MGGSCFRRQKFAADRKLITNVVTYLQVAVRLLRAAFAFVTTTVPKNRRVIRLSKPSC